jgi:hypothetical protein
VGDKNSRQKNRWQNKTLMLKNNEQWKLKKKNSWFWIESWDHRADSVAHINPKIRWGVEWSCCRCRESEKKQN